MRRRNVLGVIAAFLCIAAASVMTAPSAGATGSAGGSFNCDASGTRCVEGSGEAMAIGSSLTGGKEVAVCQGGSTGAVLLAVTCDYGGRSSTTSFPGPAGAAFVVIDHTLPLKEVCWSVTGFFPNPVGPSTEVTTSDCALLVI